MKSNTKKKLTKTERLFQKRLNIMEWYKCAYSDDSLEYAAFRDGFSEEKARASKRALEEALAYHRFTVSEAPSDRAWAEKLGTQTSD